MKRQARLEANTNKSTCNQDRASRMHEELQSQKEGSKQPDFVSGQIFEQTASKGALSANTQTRRRSVTRVWTLPSTLTTQPSNHTRGYDPGKTKTYVHRKICMWVFVATLFNTNPGNQTSLNVVRWTSTLRCVHTTKWHHQPRYTQPRGWVTATLAGAQAPCCRNPPRASWEWQLRGPQGPENVGVAAGILHVGNPGKSGHNGIVHPHDDDGHSTRQ